MHAHTSGCLQALLQLWCEPRAEEADTTAERLRKERILTKHEKAQTAGRRRSDRWDLVGDSAAFSVIMTGKTVRDGERVEVGVRAGQRWFRSA